MGCGNSKSQSSKNLKQLNKQKKPQIKIQVALSIEEEQLQNKKIDQFDYTQNKIWNTEHQQKCISNLSIKTNRQNSDEQQISKPIILKNSLNKKQEKSISVRQLAKKVKEQKSIYQKNNLSLFNNKDYEDHVQVSTTQTGFTSTTKYQTTSSNFSQIQY
ncbi:hypothetical protein PPERSA_06892 [Pseudocohnilembus persalinus]|uniref:Uncharacterized protein n=1 Tax=Pseudocohnilembus persalinus TaxID=266149 RepID=A0A0V0QYY8_PSEPJ|nr:hypothetical protein PPERSA_06892 [Pseudocohnilembus persalinus]|eukprot:KRX07277.1 hypothetical protein PPERSA_06892 [Pseudocohnilembus persalinus]